MAKSKSDFSDVNQFLSNFESVAGGGALAEDYDVIEPSLWCHTGNYMFNACISGSLLKGTPSNKIVTIAGDPKTGKSFLVFNMMRELIDQGYFFWFFETENSPDRDRLEIQLGAERMKKVRIVQPEMVKQVTVAMIQMTDPLMKQYRENQRLKPENRKELPKIGVVIDSLTGLNSTKQYNDALEGKMTQDMGGVAKELKELFNMMATRSGKLDIPIICTAHIYEAQMQNFTQRTATGGKGVYFLSSVLVALRKKFDKDKETREKTGITVTAEIIESRYSQHVPITFRLKFNEGMNPYFGMERYFDWDICGIDRGKFADIVDLGYELYTKKKVDKSTFASKKFTYAEFKAAIAKGKVDALQSSINELIEMGYMVKDENDKYQMTDKYKKFTLKGDKPQKLEKQIGVVNRSSNNWIAKHLGRVVSPKELFSSVVITPELIKKMDVHARAEFEYGGQNSTEDGLGEAEDEAAINSSLSEFHDMGDNEE